MGIKTEQKRVKKGGELESIFARATNALSILSTTRNELTALKVEIEADGDFKSEDSTDVDNKITELNQAIADLVI